MWLMQQMNHILKINGVYHKMVGGRATTESANGQDHPVQSANYCNHLQHRQAQLAPAIERPFFILGVMYSVHFEQGNICEKQMDHSDETWKEYMIVKIGCPSMSK